MAQNPPEGMQRVIPYLLYADAPAALEFLGKAFGFEERFRMPMPDGKLGHAEVGYRATSSCSRPPSARMATRARGISPLVTL